VTLAATYGRFARRRWLLLGLLVLALAAAFLFDVATGPSGMPLARVLEGLVDPAALSRPQRVILWEVRLPHAVMAAVVGAALGLAGAEMQTVLNNPLASPFTLGLAAAATVGAAIVIVFDWQIPGIGQRFIIPANAFVFATASIMLVQALARLQGGSSEAVVLFGIAMSFAMNALVALVQFFADADAIQQIVFWTMGSLTRATWDKITVVAVVLAVVAPFSLRRVWALTTLRAGEEQARSLGLNVTALRLGALARAGLLTGAAIAFVGAIGFVGLIGPHIARLLLGEDHRFFLPGSALAGALVLALASVVAKSLIPGIIVPVGIVTALVGIPIFMLLILTRGRQ